MVNLRKVTPVFAGDGQHWNGDDINNLVDTLQGNSSDKIPDAAISDLTWAKITMAGSEVADIADTVITALANNDVLTWETATSKWKNKPIPAGVSLSAANTWTGVQTFKDGDLVLRNPADTANIIIKGGAQGVDKTFTMPVANSDTLAALASIQTLTNKTMDAGSNTFIRTVQSPLIKRTGFTQPKANTLFLSGALADHTFGTTGTIANSFDTTEGIVTALPSTAASGVAVGLVSPTTGVGIGRRLFAGRAIARCKIDLTASSRFYFGFTSATALPISDTPLANTDHGVLVGWRSTDTNFQVFNNDGSAAEVVTQVTGPIPIDTAYHTFDISWTAAGNISVTVDATTMTVSTRMPATTSNLFFNQQTQTTTTTAKTQTSHGTWVEFDK